MGTLDIIFLVVLGVAAIRGAVRGFVSEVMSFAAIILALVASVLLYAPVAGLLDEIITRSPWAEIAAFLGVFLVTYLVVKLVERVAHSVFESLNLHHLDRVLGLFLGLLEGGLVAVLILMVLHWQPLFDAEPLLAESWFESILFPLLPELEGLKIFESLGDV